MLEGDVGTVIAFTGAALSVIGSLVNNIFHQYVLAMKIWMVSNPALILWAIGFLAGWWNGGLSIAIILCMYMIFTVGNLWGLLHLPEEDDPLSPPKYV